MEKKISVIIPTYNTEQYIKGCVESVLNQTYQNFEIIVVNDGSTDNTLKILDEIKSDKLEVITIKNSGQGYARNMALKKATGDYIMFLDSD
ncbi:MAG: glycosyltransferase family 2 protein, partial [Clostridia bacterium]|nr:glycosyltransferase family 2 protein [Clostridia bacterium]